MGNVHSCKRCGEVFKSGWDWSNTEFCRSCWPIVLREVSGQAPNSPSSPAVGASQHETASSPPEGIRDATQNRRLAVEGVPPSNVMAPLNRMPSPRYEYLMVQVPPTIQVQQREMVGNEAAAYLSGLVNRHSASGWDFYRVDAIGVLVNPGCLASLFGAKQQQVDYYVVTFRRQADTAS